MAKIIVSKRAFHFTHEQEEYVKNNTKNILEQENTATDVIIYVTNDGKVMVGDLESVNMVVKINKLKGIVLFGTTEFKEFFDSVRRKYIIGHYSKNKVYDRLYEMVNRYLVVYKKNLKPKKAVIVVATHNEDKVREFNEAFKGTQYTFKSAKELNAPDVEETGKTFLENARLKAHAVADFTGLPTVADDSGLVVDALGGEPGVYSARYAGDHNEDANNKKLLSKLEGIGNRKAHYNTTLVLAFPKKDLDVVVEGIVNGTILDTPRGNGGFGYDPYFYYKPLGKTFAELTDAEKNKVSQRGLAIKKLIPQLKQYLYG